ncbi:MAG: hypothetical protein B6U72_05245 [Candidatus Altiarchaeales archaeon ex4484_2]|nr:MAG: hypothetical protein B6U72_05245 [Candidatus Altiarchaeales archaeon ex4484_2]
MAKIMVVDDEENIREGVRGVLEGEGYEVDTASNANEAWIKLEEKRVDLILLDVMMPGMTTDKFIKKMGERYGRDSGTRIIYISGVGFLDRNVSRDAKIRHLTGLVTELKGGDKSDIHIYDFVVDLLEKPFSREDLLAKVEKALGD